MRSFNLGKKLYKSSALWQFKIFYLFIALALLGNLIFQTLSDPDFIKFHQATFEEIVRFHLKYPEDFFTYVFGILFPAIYYSFVRGIVFYEEGIVINRGLPFFNRSLRYKNISKYKVIHPKFLMSLRRSDFDEEFLFTIRDIDRAVAILDQNGIQGDLGPEELKRAMSINKKLIIFFFAFGVVMFFIQYIGLARMIFR